MDREAIAQAVREDFASWSGGFPPETEHEIRVYLDYTCPVDAPEAVLLDILYEWAEEDEETPIAPSAAQPCVQRLRSRTHFGSTLWFVDDDRGGREPENFRSSGPGQG
jgi:hypothetical protein